MIYRKLCSANFTYLLLWRIAIDEASSHVRYEKIFEIVAAYTHSGALQREHDARARFRYFICNSQRKFKKPVVAKKKKIHTSRARPTTRETLAFIFFRFSTKQEEENAYRNDKQNYA
jgi:hypothetical protein